MEAIAIRLEAIAIRLEAIAIGLEAIAKRLEAIAIRLEDFQSKSLLPVDTQIIDDDAFPGNKHREEILKGEDAIWNISGFSLFSEFFRLNFIRHFAALFAYAIFKRF